MSTLNDKCEAHSTWLSAVKAKYTHHALFVISLCTWLMNALVWKWFLWRTNGVAWQGAARNTTLSLMQCGGSHFARDSWCKSRENVLTRSQWEVRECEQKREGEMEMNKMIFYRLSDHVSGVELLWFLQAQWLTLAFCSLALLLCSFVPVFLAVGCLLLSLLFFNLLISPLLLFSFQFISFPLFLVLFIPHKLQRYVHTWWFVFAEENRINSHRVR